MSADGNTTLLKDNIAMGAGDLVDATKMSRTALRSFIKDSIAEAKKAGRSFISSYEGYDDESFRPHHFWSWRDCFL